MSGVRKQDTLYDQELASKKQRNVVAIVDVGQGNHCASRLELENGIFYFDSTDADRILMLPSARELVLDATAGMDHLLGHVMSFTVMNVCRPAEGETCGHTVTVVMPEGERLHYSLPNAPITVGPNQKRQFLLSVEYVDYEQCGCAQDCDHARFAHAPAPPANACHHDCRYNYSEDCDKCYRVQYGHCGAGRTAPKACLVLYQA